jgi:cell division transport system permease protein
MKKCNKLGYFIKEGFSSIFTHGFMSFASVCIIIACLIIMGSFTLLALNVNAIIEKYEDENIILAYIDETYTPEQAAALESEILKIENVASVDFMSREEAMSSFVEDYDESLFEGIEATNFRDRYLIYLDDIAFAAQTQDDLKNIEGIDRVNAHLELASGFVKTRNIVSGISIVLVVILLVVSLFIMSNTIKLAMFERRDEIAIMKMVGATNSFIRWPFVLEGFILGILGSLIAFILQWGIYSAVADRLLGRANVSIINIIPFSATSIPLLVAFVALGFCVGVGSSVVTIRNYLKV